jgi:hypothetical protein
MRVSKLPRFPAEDRPHRWATRREGMIYARVGSTKMNELMQSGRIHAKKDGKKVIVDLNSIDAYYAALPAVGSAAA